MAAHSLAAWQYGIQYTAYNKAAAMKPAAWQRRSGSAAYSAGYAACNEQLQQPDIQAAWQPTVYNVQPHATCNGLTKHTAA
jgi:hypothetical protein